MEVEAADCLALTKNAERQFSDMQEGWTWMQRAKGSSVFLCFFSNASYLLQGVEVLKLPLKDCEAIKGTEFCQVCGGLCLLQREKRFMLWFHKSPALIWSCVATETDSPALHSCFVPGTALPSSNWGHLPAENWSFFFPLTRISLQLNIVVGPSNWHRIFIRFL